MSLLEKYAKYSSELLDQIQFVIVDDGSPIRYTIPDLNLNIIWLKIMDDIPWNQGGARNLGVVYAKSDKVLVTDLDHEFPEETLAYMVKRRQCGRKFYRIRRTGAKTKGHPNIFLLSRARFLRLYGYDEEFCGHYGAEDYRMVKIHKYCGTHFPHLPGKYRCFQRDDIDRDTSYHSLNRDLTHNTPIDLRKKNEILSYGPDSGHSRMFLNFRWKVMKTHCRSLSFERKKHLLWKHLWYWRWLFGYK